MPPGTHRRRIGPCAQTHSLPPMGKPQRRTRTSVKDKQGTKSRRTRRRTKDIDQIQDEIARVSKLAAADGASASDPQHRPIDPEKPGLGQFLCVYCDQYFISDAVMKEHLRSKPHKKRCVQGSCGLLLFSRPSAFCQAYDASSHTLTGFCAPAVFCTSHLCLRVKTVQDKPYSQRDADAAAGMGAPIL